jgi:hypothetical protein
MLHSVMLYYSVSISVRLKHVLYSQGELRCLSFWHFLGVFRVRIRVRGNFILFFTPYIIGRPIDTPGRFPEEGLHLLIVPWYLVRANPYTGSTRYLVGN